MIGFLLAMDTGDICRYLVLEVVPGKTEEHLPGGLRVVGGLIVAGMVQPIVGRYSDRTRSVLGRRVPYLIWGCGMVCLGLVGIGFAESFVALLLVWLFVQANVERRLRSLPGPHPGPGAGKSDRSSFVHQDTFRRRRKLLSSSWLQARLIERTVSGQTS